GKSAAVRRFRVQIIRVQRRVRKSRTPLDDRRDDGAARQIERAPPDQPVRRVARKRTLLARPNERRVEALGKSGANDQIATTRGPYIAHEQLLIAAPLLSD